ncbi:aminotransferase class III-fold pyridoxal phosphate-dependent enzyme [Aquicoccus sp. SCR17]|nr:aminotransferase class III-fold pyridoxal phosphate-dependent enzyme [Carideicomes alvinocaridis]
MNMLSNSNAERDARSIVHPYSNLSLDSRERLLTIVKGDGCYVEDDQGNRYLEGMAGLWCTSLGFSEERLAEVASTQLRTLPYYHLFNHRSTEPSINLAEKLLEIAPEGLSKVLFANSGSEANDQAVKLVWYYNNQKGRPEKKKILSRWRGYHGVTVAAGSLTGLPANHADFDLPIKNILHADCPSHYHHANPGETEEDFAARLAESLEAQILAEGPETVAALIAEPVSGSGGVIVPPKGYYERVQEILKKYDILLVADEVICGFGRTGKMFGCETFGLKPDIMTVAKALSSSYLPISATLVSDEIYDAMVDESRKQGVFAHGVTYAGHPVCAAVALETLKIYEERDILGHVAEVSPHFLERLHRLGAHPHVSHTRGVGLIGAIELVVDKESRRPFPPEQGVGARIQLHLQRNGVIVRALRDAVAFCPPLIISKAEIDVLFDAMENALKYLEQELAPRLSPSE